MMGDVLFYVRQMAMEVIKKSRNQSEARRIAELAYPYPGCCLCGQTVGRELAHLDHEASNNDPDNLAWLCNHHHWMYDAGLFSLAALKLQRSHWQDRKGERTNAYMKDAGKKAAATRAANAIKKRRSDAARKAVATRRANAARIAQ
ncbi:HNH endonuclease [Bradyrhizobium diazoefficiens]|uniref:HNH endonuclease signature motif containing protein n=1 Tax=Bradyrhizobium diazoefficiens TaxID=1355477 RepID=UPI001B8CA1D4|nr:HNH endonuclease signature motif containing protein [Bradyrhizobium diazoefficiens]MBR0868487.1 HNH endonuclease [Bradyrhizobium diazoefficiens]MBR0893003.1 HNH endonuclease [Bradyrhizobium diazoefficiens]MBR0924741.1 HNH endonuclease [Bradyrhizobium diazoefficiens]